MIKKLFYTSFIFAILSTVLLLTAVYLSVSNTATVAASRAIAEEDANTIRQIIASNKPAAVLSRATTHLKLSNAEANEILRFANLHYERKLRAHTVFSNNRIEAKFSYQLPENPVGQFLNIRVKARVHYAKYFIIEELDIGSLPIPLFMIEQIQPVIVKLIKKYYGGYFALWKHVKRIDIIKKDLTIYYQIQRSDFRKLKNIAGSLVVDDVLRERITAYSIEMDNIITGLATEPQSIIKVLSPMFRFAEKRALLNSEPEAENRIALLTLAAYMVGKNPLAYISDSPVTARKKIELTLKGRHDLAQHFLVSAGINAMTNSVWSNAIGLKKELRDADGGSGFSFVDLMADLAGNKLASLAFDKKTATSLQTQLINIRSEEEIMGDIEGLQEGLSKSEFRIEFGNTSSEEYVRVVREVRRRLLTCSMYRL